MNTKPTPTRSEVTRSARTRSRTARLVLFLVLVGVVFGVGLAAGVRWSSRIRGALGLEVSTTSSAASTEKGQLWTCGMHPQVLQDRPGSCPICGMTLTPVASSGTGPRAGASERRIQYWWDPMTNPPYVSEQPGTSPMGMELVPVYEDEGSAGSALLIDPAVVQNMGLRLARVAQGPLARTIRAVGVLAEPEPARHDVNLRLGGWIERLQAGTEGMRLARGDALFDLYSPELQVAVEELIGARKLRDTQAAPGQAEVIFDSAARKLELYGLAPEQVDELARLDAAPRSVRFTSPADGFLVEKHVYAGSAVMAGDTVMRIADTAKMWLDARVFERDLPAVHGDQEVSATVEGWPGQTFSGHVILVHPRIDPTTRTALVRMEIDNPALTLRQGMFATASLRVELATDAVVVPREAIIDTGVRQVAFVQLEGGHFEPREVALGASGAEGMVQVLSGLAAGEQVVVSGQFLLDAESRMQEAIRRFLQQKVPVPPAAHAHEGGQR